MKSDNHDEIRRRLSSVPAAKPPADLASKIKAEIPQDLRVIEEQGAGSRSDRAALWRLAASVLMIFGFAYVAARTYLESRVAERTALSRVPAAVSAPAEESRSASNETVAAPAAEMKREMEHDDLLKLTEPPAAPPFAPEVQRQAKAERRENAMPSAAAAPAKTAEAEKPAAFDSVEEVQVSESLTVTASAPKVAQPAAQAARTETTRAATAADAAAGAAAPAPPPAARAFGYASSAPRVISRVYPEREAARKDLQGTSLTFVVTIGADGRVKTVKPITRLSRRDAAAWIDAIGRWRFEPATREGEAVEATTRVVIDPAAPVTPEQ